MESGEIKDSQITASSWATTWGDRQPYRGRYSRRLESSMPSWCSTPGNAVGSDFLQVSHYDKIFLNFNTVYEIQTDFEFMVYCVFIPWPNGR